MVTYLRDGEDSWLWVWRRALCVETTVTSPPTQNSLPASTGLSVVCLHWELFQTARARADAHSKLHTKYVYTSHWKHRPEKSVTRVKWEHFFQSVCLSHSLDCMQTNTHLYYTPTSTSTPSFPDPVRTAGLAAFYEWLWDWARVLQIRNVSVCVCVCLRVSVYVCEILHLCIQTCLCSPVFVCVCVCVCVCVWVRVKDDGALKYESSAVGPAVLPLCVCLKASWDLKTLRNRILIADLLHQLLHNTRPSGKGVCSIMSRIYHHTNAKVIGLIYWVKSNITAWMLGIKQACKQPSSTWIITFFKAQLISLELWWVRTDVGNINGVCRSRSDLFVYKNCDVFRANLWHITGITKWVKLKVIHADTHNDNRAIKTFQVDSFTVVCLMIHMWNKAVKLVRNVVICYSRKETDLCPFCF